MWGGALYPASCNLVDVPQYDNQGRQVIEVRKTEIFDAWFKNLVDKRAKARIQARIDRMETGNFGDTRSIGKGVRELRIHHGPGYRVYFTQRGPVIVILLCGGEKRTQRADISKAQGLANKLED